MTLDQPGTKIIVVDPKGVATFANYHWPSPTPIGHTLPGSPTRVTSSSSSLAPKLATAVVIIGAMAASTGVGVRSVSGVARMTGVVQQPAAHIDLKPIEVPRLQTFGTAGDHAEDRAKGCAGEGNCASQPEPAVHVMVGDEGVVRELLSEVGKEVLQDLAKCLLEKKSLDDCQDKDPSAQGLGRLPDFRFSELARCLGSDDLSVSSDRWQRCAAQIP